MSQDAEQIPSDESLDIALKRLWETDAVDNNLNDLTTEERWCE